MSYHDYVLDNQTGASFRADLNSCLQAIVSLNAASSSPAVSYAYQLWADTSVTPAMLRVRKSDNSAWIALFPLDTTGGAFLPLAGGTLTGALAAAVGTVSAPGISFAGDTGTGIYHPAANTLGMVVGGVEVLRLSASYAQYFLTTALIAPSGTTAQRPATGVNGMFRYNSTSNKFEGYANSTWQNVGSGGGGAGFVWRSIGGTQAPLVSEELNEQVSLFSQGLSQSLYAAVKVPNSYSPGSQITLYLTGYSPSTANTIAMKSISTLIRAGTDGFDSTTNQRSSTNAALTNTVANQLRQFVLDVTDSVGAVNGVAVSPGDVLKVQVYRDPTDTDTADLRILTNATDAKFS